MTRTTTVGRSTVRTVTGAGVLLAALVLGACTTQVPGVARPAAEEPPAPAADLGTVDLCGLLPADRLTELGLAPGGGPVCTVFVEVDGGVLSLLGGTDCAATQRLAEAAVTGLGG